MSRSRHPFRAWLLVAAALLTACSGVPLRERQEANRARFQAYAGKPVDRFTWLTNYNGWQPIAPDQLVVWTDLNEAYLVTVWRPCTDLMFARRIGFTSFARTVYARSDSVTADRWRCRIKTIQPIDYRRMRRDLREQRVSGNRAPAA